MPVGLNAALDLALTEVLETGLGAALVPVRHEIVFGIVCAAYGGTRRQGGAGHAALHVVAITRCLSKRVGTAEDIAERVVSEVAGVPKLVGERDQVALLIECKRRAGAAWIDRGGHLAVRVIPIAPRRAERRALLDEQSALVPDLRPRRPVRIDDLRGFVA